MSASGYRPIGRALSLTLGLDSHIFFFSFPMTFSLPSKEHYDCPH